MENRETTDGRRDRQPLWQQRQRRKRERESKEEGRGNEASARVPAAVWTDGEPAVERGGWTAGGVTAREVELAELSCRDAAAA